MKKLKNNWDIWLFFLLAISFRVIIFFIADNVIDIKDYETHSRLFEARRWINDGWFYPSTYFPPGYYFIIRICWFFYNVDISLLPRIANIILGSSILFIYIPFMRLYFTKSVVFCSSLILCFLSLPVRCSVVTVASVSYILFVFLAFYFFVIYLKRQKESCFWLYILFINISIAFRFEAILFLPPLFFVLLKVRRIKYLFLFSTLSLATFMFHLFVCYLASGNMFEAISGQNYDAYGSIIKICPTVNMRLESFLNSFLTIFSPLGLILIIIGLLIAIVKRQSLLLVFIFGVTFLVLLVKTIGGTFESYFLRYYNLWSVFLLPYMFLPLEKLCEKLKCSKKFMIGFAVIMAVFHILDTVDDAKSEKPMAEYKQVISWINDNLKPNETLLLDRVHRHYIIIEASIPDRQILDPVCIEDSCSVVDVDATLEMIDKKAPLILVVYRYNGGGYKEVGFLDLMEKRRKYTMDVVYENEVWQLIKIELAKKG